MNKILGIVGSPRKTGNTHHMVTLILQGARMSGAHTEVLYLSDFLIKECDGCHVCWQGKGCNKADDMIGIYPKICESDVIVFGTPVYWYGPTALMKCFIDRFVYFNCEETRKSINGLTAAIAIPFEDTTIESSDLLVRFFESCFSYLQINLVGKVLAPGVTQRGEVKNNKSVMDECLKLGKAIAAVEYNRKHNQAAGGF